VLTIKIAIFATIYLALVAWSLIGMTKDLRKGLPLLAIITVLSSIHPRTEDKMGFLYEYWLIPLQFYRSESMLLTSAFIAMGLVINVTRFSWWRFPLPVALIIIGGMYGGLLRIIHAGPVEGLTTLGFAILTLIPPAALAIGSLRDREDGDRLLRIMGYAGIFWVAGALIQLLVHQRMAYIRTGFVENYRFGGLMTNPQHASVYIALIGGLFFHLALNSKTLFGKVVWFGTLSITVPMLLATGSRTGAVMLLFCCLPASLTRIGPAALLIPPAAGIAYFIAKAIAGGGLNVSTDRFLSTENTRTHAWKGLLEKGMESPMIGVGVQEAEFSENSYLLAFASYGVLSLLITLAVALASGFLVARLIIAWRRMDSGHARLAMYAIGSLGAYLFGSLLEGYMLSRVNVVHYVFFVMCSVGVFTLRSLNSAQPTTDEFAPVDDAPIDDPGSEEINPIPDHAGGGLPDGTPATS
jgi:hypothetical protein